MTIVGLAPNGGGFERWAWVTCWAHHRLSNGAIVGKGLMLERPLQAGCAPSSLPYILGVELMARVDLGLADDVNIILMHRALKRSLEKSPEYGSFEAVKGLHTQAPPLPEELARLSIDRDTGWPGSSAEFRARFA